MLIYGALFGVGKLLLHETSTGLELLAMGAIGFAVIYRDLSRRGWSAVVDRGGNCQVRLWCPTDLASPMRRGKRMPILATEFGNAARAADRVGRIALSSQAACGYRTESGSSRDRSASRCIGRHGAHHWRRSTRPDVRPDRSVRADSRDREAQSYQRKTGHGRARGPHDARSYDLTQPWFSSDATGEAISRPSPALV